MPPPFDLALLPPHDWDELLARTWSRPPKKQWTPENWYRAALSAIHHAIADRQFRFLSMCAELLNYGWCRCSDGKLQVARPWSPDDYAECHDLGYDGRDPEQWAAAGEIPAPIGFMDWPLSWMDWGLVESLIACAKETGRYSDDDAHTARLYARLCYDRYPNRWGDELADLFCQALYDWPACPRETEIQAFYDRMISAPPQEKPLPALPGDPWGRTLPMLAALALLQTGASPQEETCPNSTSPPQSKPSSPPPARSPSAASAAARIRPSTSTGSKGPAQLSMLDWSLPTPAPNTRKTPTGAGPPRSTGASSSPPTTAIP